LKDSIDQYLVGVPAAERAQLLEIAAESESDAVNDETCQS
jgi:hypothetical protein